MNPCIPSIEKQYAKKIAEIIELVDSPIYKTLHLITGQWRFVICGASGSGKTLSIKFANQKLSDDDQIAESNDILFLNDINDIERILADDSYCYEGAKHIAYSTVRRNIGKELMARNMYPVIFMD